MHHIPSDHHMFVQLHGLWGKPTLWIAGDVDGPHKWVILLFLLFLHPPLHVIDDALVRWSPGGGEKPKNQWRITMSIFSAIYPLKSQLRKDILNSFLKMHFNICVLKLNRLWSMWLLVANGFQVRRGRGGGLRPFMLIRDSLAVKLLVSSVLLFPQEGRIASRISHHSLLGYPGFRPFFLCSRECLPFTKHCLKNNTLVLT